MPSPEWPKIRSDRLFGRGIKVLIGGMALLGLGIDSLVFGDNQITETLCIGGGMVSVAGLGVLRHSYKELSFRQFYTDPDPEPDIAPIISLYDYDGGEQLESGRQDYTELNQAA